MGNGHLGYPPCAPYDAIHVGAAADCIESCWIEQLKPGGAILAPVGDDFMQQMRLVVKNMDGTIMEEFSRNTLDHAVVSEYFDLDIRPMANVST